MLPLAETLRQWEEQQIVTPQQHQQLHDYERQRPVSLYWLLRTLLSVGLLAFTTGAGMLIYEHIDTIGHEVLIAVLAVLTAACFYYTYRYSAPFSTQLTQNEGKFADIALLLGCTLFLSLEGYVQWRYAVFGTRYGLATVIPAVLFLFCAYRFDHRGVLSMGLTALASWVGLTVAPLELFASNDFSDPSLIYTAVIFSLAVLGLSVFLEKQHIKPHFSFTYFLLVGNLLFVSALAGLFTDAYWYIFALLVLGAAWFFFRHAQRTQSFVFLLMAVVYSYICLTYLAFKILPEESLIFLVPFYFMASAGGVVWFIISYKKLLKNSAL
ncbi:MAG: DUF2157 domain-containing protein [Spirosomaceae bacterium]|jgi:hypothetical protein|nr:DUF2157 domain-containing protein [Spirosomataceae bacterium]